MKLARIEVRRLPGLGPPFTVDGLAPGLNLVVGPNGVGKSSLMRAVRATLWGEPRLEHPDVVTVWDDAGATFRAELLSSSRRWQRDGGNVPPPEVPDPSVASTWAVGLTDLLSSGATEAALLERVQREMAGGYDVGAALSTYQLGARHGRAEQKALSEAQAGLREIEGRRAALVGREDGLAELRRRHADAKRAAREAGRLAQALEHAEVRARLEAVRGRIEGQPAALARVTEDDPRRLDELRADHAAATQELEAVRAALAAAEAEARQADLEAPLEETRLKTWRIRAREVAESTREVAARRDEVEAARAALAEARRAVAPDLDPDDPALPADGPALEAVQQWAEDVLAARAALAAVEARLAGARRSLDGLGPVPDPSDRDALRTAEALLDRAAAAPPADRAPRGLLAAAVVLILAGLAAAFLLGPWLVVLAGAGLGLGAGALLSRRGGPDPVAAAREAWPADVPPPGAWTPDAARSRREALRARLHAATRADLLREEVLRLEAERDAARADADRREAGREGLARGLPAGLGELHLADLLGRLSRLGEARAALAAREAALASADARLDGRTAPLREELARWSPRPPADAAGLEALLDDLADRSTRLRDARARLADLEQQAAGLTGRVQRLEARSAELLAAAGLGDLDPDHARARLADLIAALPDRRAALEELRHLEQRLGEIGALLDAPELLELDPPTLQARLEAAQAEADGADGLLREIATVEKELDAERRTSDHEEALAAVEAAREGLAAARDARVHHEAARLLLEDVRREHAAESAPAVFRKVRELFTGFTRGRYDLQLSGLDAGRPELRAFDRTTLAGLGLAELSDGTRMQLLLATRVAFAASQETGAPLPLFLDESLTATDPDRFRAVADAVLGVIAREGRQIFYLTSDPADVARWRSACNARGLEPPRVVDLGEVRQVAAALTDDALVLEEASPVPDPAGLGAAAYGRLLEVPRFDPFLGDAETAGGGRAGSLHLFHLLRDDLPLLHRLLSARVDRLGPLLGLLTGSEGGSLVAEAERGRLLALGGVAEAFAEAWCEGRGRPVDRAAIEESGTVSERYLDAVAAIAAEVGGDAEALLTVLRGGSKADARLQRFRSRYADELETWLREHGHLDPRAPLDDSALMARCLEAAEGALAAGVLRVDEVTRTVDALAAATGRPRPRKVQAELFGQGGGEQTG